MTKLAPNLFERRFHDFLEIGRARLPSLAPEWTDHNAHDPGIMLMELLAWVAEAQLYSLSRLRRDERAAYASLLGVAPRGTLGASGLIWPDRADPQSPASTSSRSIVLRDTDVVSVLAEYGLAFHPRSPILWTPGRLEHLETRGADGQRVDHTATNARGGIPFLPFGAQSGSRDVLALTFAARDPAGLFGANREAAVGGLWAIGVQAAPPVGGDSELAAESKPGPSSLSATLVTDDDEFDVPIKWDSTRGFLSTGVLLLNLDQVANLPQRFTLKLRAPRGFPRPPRVLRIEPNTVPIVQGRMISAEAHGAHGEPDWGFVLDAPGLQFVSGADPITVEVADSSGLQKWERREQLSECDPEDRVYEFDVATGRILFGNGVNGAILPAGAQVLVTYAVSDGEAGRVARNRTWKISCLQGPLGVNLDSIQGGNVAPDWIEQRRDARRRARESHVLVTEADVATAARDLPLLEVARAWTAVSGRNAPRTGTTTLVALRHRPAGHDKESILETPRWLESIRRALAPRMLLGSRLKVVAPRYAPFMIEAVLVAEPGRNPAVVEEDAKKILLERLALVDSSSALPPREPGVPVTQRDVSAWMRGVEGVQRVARIRLRTASGKRTEAIKPSPNGLPWWDRDQSSIEVQRPKPGRPR